MQKNLKKMFSIRCLVLYRLCLFFLPGSCSPPPPHKLFCLKAILVGIFVVLYHCYFFFDITIIIISNVLLLYSYPFLKYHFYHYHVVFKSLSYIVLICFYS
ncbi:hypothetical protein EGW08_019018 [Elysia chlorotica]|uniref:Uncharacterized protein n=1 Tax=Elysia chlorotica TaxID=188477 RepID=A0A3S1B275_ELYCH|nr:hypothetical protein EGW08_019018 [Elysia chlorotica]